MSESLTRDNQHLFILLYKILESLNEIKYLLSDATAASEEYVLNDYILDYIDEDELQYPNWYVDECIENDYIENRIIDEYCIRDECVLLPPDECCIQDECVLLPQDECCIQDECIEE